MEKLGGGAELMLPGVSKSSLESLSDDLPQGALVGIGTPSISGAIRALGILAGAAKALKKEGRGKAVEVLHIEGDYLWALGCKITLQPRVSVAPTGVDSDLPLAGTVTPPRDAQSMPETAVHAQDVATVRVTLSASGLREFENIYRETS